MIIFMKCNGHMSWEDVVQGGCGTHACTPQHKMCEGPCSNAEHKRARNNRLCERERERATTYCRKQNVLGMHSLHKEAHDFIFENCENMSYKKWT